MSRLRKALAKRTQCHRRVLTDRQLASAAAAELKRQYQVMPALPLSVAALAGAAWSRHGHRFRPPPGVFLLALRGVIGLGRGML